MSKVAIIYLVWSNEPEKYLARALKGVADQTYNKNDTHLLVVYNSHKPDEASQLPLIQGLVEKNKDVLPTTTILTPEKNLGFSGGNNLGMQWAIDNNFDYVFLHNADGFLAPQGIEKLVATMDSDKNIGQAQSLILLHPDNDLINTAGNAWNFLGVGYCTSFREKVSDNILKPIVDIGYVSGAATMMRVDLLKKYGLWLEEFFMYHEDTEYSLRLKIRGFRTVLSAESIFYHEYQFSKSVKKFYWIERNRRVLKFLFYKRATILLLWPLEFLYSCGLFFVFLKNGWYREFFDGLSYWFGLKNRMVWKKYRDINMRERVVSDRWLIKQASITIDSASVGLSSVVKSAVDIVFTFYYYLLKILVWW